MSTSVSENSISKLCKIVTDEVGELSKWSQNYLNLHLNRYEYDLQTLQKYYSDGQVLEIGSAPYQLTYLIKEAGYPIIGIDIDPDRQADFIRSAGLDIRKNDIDSEELPFEDNSFKYILFNEVFEHLRINPIQTLNEIRRVLHPDGVLVLSTPNLYSLQNVIKMFSGKGFDSPFQEFNKLQTIGHMGHVREYSLSQMKEFVENTGYKIVEVDLVSHRPIKGIFAPLNLITKAFPFFNKYQVLILKKDE